MSGPGRCITSPRPVTRGHTFDLLPLNCGPDMQVNYFTYKQEDFTCQHCGWKGKGIELGPGDFSEAHSILDLDCPSCYEHLAR
jgi:hypothetical protein